MTIKVVAYPDKVFAGKVDWISDALDPTSRTARVRCAIANPEPRAQARDVRHRHHRRRGRRRRWRCRAPRSCASATRRWSSSSRERRPTGGSGSAAASSPSTRTRGPTVCRSCAALQPRRSGRHLGRDPALGNAARAPMIQRLVRFVLRMPAFVLILARRPAGARALLLQAARHRGLPQPGAADDRDHHPAERLERRGGRALRHHPARERPQRDARSRPHPLAVAVRPLGREVLLQLGRRLPHGASSGS